jgi:hypothetical protein
VRRAALPGALGTALTVIACGGAPPPVDTSAVAARATEPRSADVTAAAPSPSPRDLTRPPASAASPASPSSAGPATTSQAPVSRIGARHVLVMYMGSSRAPESIVRTRDQAHALAEDVLKRARAGEDFARIAVESSDEPGAAGRGGSLGRFGRGQMVPAFEEAAFKLKVGEISDVVETPFGFHIIQRTE